MAVVLFSSWLLSPQRYDCSTQTILCLPYADRIMQTPLVRKADFFIFTSLHAASIVSSQWPVFFKAICLVSGPSCARVLKSNCPLVDIRQNSEMGVGGIINELSHVSGKGIWYRGRTVVNAQVFDKFCVESIEIYDIEPWHEHPDLLGAVQSGFVRDVCLESMQQAVALNRWLKYNRSVQLWVKSERIRQYLLSKGWMFVKKNAEMIDKLRKQIRC